MRTSYLAHLDLIGSTLSLSEITALVGHPPDPTSHDIGTRSARGRTWEHSIWRLSYAAGDDASLEHHLSELRHRAEKRGLLDKLDLPDDLRRVLKVAAMPRAGGDLDSPTSASMLVPPFVAGFATSTRPSDR